MKQSINCKIPEELKKQLKNQADEEMRSQASIIRQSINEYCEASNP